MCCILLHQEKQVFSFAKSNLKGIINVVSSMNMLRLLSPILPLLCVSKSQGKLKLSIFRNDRRLCAGVEKREKRKTIVIEERRK